MENEDAPAGDRKDNRNKVIAIMLLVIVVGAVLYVLPMLMYPDNVVHDASLTDANSHSTKEQLDIAAGTYEVWMSTSFWSWFNLDTPEVYVNESASGQPVVVDYLYDDDRRSFEGEECRRFAKFDLERDTAVNISITAGVISLGIPGSERVFVVEERPTAYAPMQWSGILTIIAGISILIIYLALLSMKSSEEKKRQAQPQPPQYPPAYPPPYPPQYPTYPPQQPPPYNQYPPPPQGQYPPPQGQYPPPQGQYPPPQGQYPPPQGQYPPPQGSQPPPGQYGRRPPY